MMRWEGNYVKVKPKHKWKTEQNKKNRTAQNRIERKKERKKERN
jgi:hypothetical protein